MFVHSQVVVWYCKTVLGFGNFTLFNKTCCVFLKLCVHSFWDIQHFMHQKFG